MAHPDTKSCEESMVYRAEFDCEHDWHDEAQREAAVAEAVFKLRTMADRLEAGRMDDILTAFDHGHGVQGWWSK